MEGVLNFLGLLFAEERSAEQKGKRREYRRRSQAYCWPRAVHEEARKDSDDSSMRRKKATGTASVVVGSPGPSFGVCIVVPLLETEPRLQLHDAARQHVLGNSEVGVVERRTPVVLPEGCQVQLVEQVEEVDAQVQLGTFAFEERNRCGFHKAGVNGLVPWAPEGIAMQERWTCSTPIKVRIADVARAKGLPF